MRICYFAINIGETIVVIEKAVNAFRIVYTQAVSGAFHKCAAFEANAYYILSSVSGHIFEHFLKQ